MCNQPLVMLDPFPSPDKPHKTEMDRETIDLLFDGLFADAQSLEEKPPTRLPDVDKRE